MTFQPENVELTTLLSVRALARKLVQSDLSHLDAIMCNAGMGGWLGMDWFKAVPDMIYDLRNSTVWPSFKIGVAGSVTQTQLSKGEPPLGEVFCANLFGHYLLNHWLMPLLRAARDSKIIWVSSIEPEAQHFSNNDLVGILTNGPYEHSKRVTDLLVLTSNQPGASKSINSFTASDFATRLDHGPPTQHVCHPGIIVTAVVSIHWMVEPFYPMGITLARLLGSPWSNVYPYSAAQAMTWLALTSNQDISQAEIKSHAKITTEPTAIVENGKVKWGTASSRLGTTRVAASEVDGWGIRGTGAPYVRTWWGGSYATGQHAMGRKPGAVEAKPADVEKFIAQGIELWAQMEELRIDWERRIEDHQRSENTQ